MNTLELFIHIANSDIDFSIVFDSEDLILKKQILDFINFLKTNPTYQQYLDYGVSKDVYIRYLNFVKLVVKKA